MGGSVKCVFSEFTSDAKGQAYKAKEHGHKFDTANDNGSAMAVISRLVYRCEKEQKGYPTKDDGHDAEGGFLSVVDSKGRSFIHDSTPSRF